MLARYNYLILTEDEMGNPDVNPSTPTATTPVAQPVDDSEVSIAGKKVSPDNWDDLLSTIQDTMDPSVGNKKLDSVEVYDGTITSTANKTSSAEPKVPLSTMERIRKIQTLPKELKFDIGTTPLPSLPASKFKSWSQDESEPKNIFIQTNDNKTYILIFRKI